MVVLSLVQLYTILPPVVGEVKTDGAVVALLQTTWSVTLTVAVGFTVMVKLRGVPTHDTPFRV